MNYDCQILVAKEQMVARDPVVLDGVVYHRKENFFTPRGLGQGIMVTIP